jgi:hypothetical protein
MVKEPDMNHDTLKQYIDEQQQERIEGYKQQAQLGAKVREVNQPVMRDRANEQQIGGEHYAVKAIQPWDFIIANNIGYLEGNIIKYISRWKDKGGVEDLKKAQHYLQKLIETHDKETVV